MIIGGVPANNELAIASPKTEVRSNKFVLLLQNGYTYSIHLVKKLIEFNWRVFLKWKQEYWSRLKSLYVALFMSASFIMNFQQIII